MKNVINKFHKTMNRVEKRLLRKRDREFNKAMKMCKMYDKALGIEPLLW